MSSKAPGGSSEAGSLTAKPRVAIFAPSPVLTVTVEQGAGSKAEIHLHAGGQGYWVARIAAVLDAEVRLCVPLGGESGTVLRAILEEAELEVLAVHIAAPNGAYVHDRRSGSRIEVAMTESPGLDRHEVDELYGVAVTAGMAADVTLLTGPQPEHALPADVYRRLARDLSANRRIVLADLTGPALAAALAAGVELLKLSSEELVGEGFASDESQPEVVRGIQGLRRAGARNVLISRAAEPAMAFADGRLIELRGPRFEAADPHGTGDAMFGAIGVGLGMGLSLDDALRMGAAAGALNVTRHGLGSGHIDEIERLRGSVSIDEVA